MSECYHSPLAGTRGAGEAPAVVAQRRLYFGSWRPWIMGIALMLGAEGCATRQAANQRAIIDRVEQFHAAIREGDAAKYVDVFTDDFLFTWSRDGRIYSRDEIVPNVVPTPDFAPLLDQYVVRLHGRAAVLSVRVRKEASDPGVRVTFSCVKRGGVWKVMATHSTTIVPGSDSDDEG